MSEQAPERVAPPPGRKENVLTRKLGPLPTWGWIAIAAALILAYVVFFGKKKKGGGTAQGTGNQGGGFGGFLQPLVIFRRNGGGVPHTHHHRRGDHDDDDDGDREHARHHDRDRQGRQPGMSEAGPGPHTDVPVGVDRRHKRGNEVMGELVSFKTAEKGATPSLLDVSNHYGTTPEAVVQEAEGRGYPSSTAWKRYVSRHDWASPLPPATDFSILAHPG